MTEKTITICGKEVKMLYCPAAEIAYESTSGKSSAVFAAHIETDENGEKKIMPSEATLGDWLQLAYGTIAAAYFNQTTPVSIEDLMLRTTSGEMTNLMHTLSDIRNEWYKVPEIVASELQEESDEEEEGEKPKN